MKTNQPAIPTIKPKDIIGYQNEAVVTTRMIADFYGTKVMRILNNYSRNQEWFVEGKHYYRLTGESLKQWRLTISQRDSQIGSKARSLLLWTQRGVGQHARMINNVSSI